MSSERRPSQEFRLVRILLRPALSLPPEPHLDVQHLPWVIYPSTRTSLDSLCRNPKLMRLACVLQDFSNRKEMAGNLREPRKVTNVPASKPAPVSDQSQLPSLTSTARSGFSNPEPVIHRNKE
jgi:hypothetical protein